MSGILQNNLLSLVIFLPLLGALILIIAFKRPPDEAESHGHEGVDEPSTNSFSAAAIRWFTLLVTLFTFGASLLLVTRFNPSMSGFQLVEGPAKWIEQYRINYHIGIDGTSLLLILLTTFTSVLSVYFSFNIKQRIKEFMVFLLVLETAMIGVFCALDLVLFYVFWEAVLIPMYFLIGIWGHEDRIYAAIKFFLYTFAGCILMQ